MARVHEVHKLHRWLCEGLDSRPPGEAVHGRKRTGFILFEFMRWPIGGHEHRAVLSMKFTTTALDGSSLDDAGEYRPT